MPHPPPRSLSISENPSERKVDNDDISRPEVSALRAAAQFLAARQHPLEITDYRTSVDSFMGKIDDEIDIQDGDESFDIVFLLLLENAGNRMAMNALSQYSIKSRSVILDKVSSNIASITECLEEAKATRDTIEADDNAAEDILATQNATINEYIRKRSHLKTRHQSLKNELSYATQHGFYPSHRLSKPDANVPQDMDRSDDEHDDVGEVQRVLVNASTTTAKRRQSRSRSGSIKTPDDMDHRETEHLATDNQCDIEPDVSNDEDEDEQPASDHKHDDKHDTRQRQHVDQPTIDHREETNSTTEEDELESDNDNELERADSKRRARGQAPRRSSTRAAKKLKETGAICVQWPGSCDQCKQANKHCRQQKPPKRRCTTCEFAETRKKKCTYNDVNTYGEVKDNNTVIAQYNGIGFSFPLGIDDAKRLVAETTVYKIEQRLVEPVHTTKFLEQKVQLYDPPHAAATEYRLFKPQLKIGPPVHVKKSRDVIASTSPVHKRKREVDDTTRQDSPEAPLARALRSHKNTASAHDTRNTTSAIQARTKASADNVEDDKTDVIRRIKKETFRIHRIPATAQGDSMSSTQLQSPESSTSQANPSRMQSKKPEVVIRSHSAHSKARSSRSRQDDILDDVFPGDVDPVVIREPGLSDVQMSDHAFQHPQSPTIIGVIASPDTTVAATDRRSLATDMLIAKYREEYNRTLVERVTADMRLDKLRQLEEKVSQREFGEYVSTSDTVVLQPALRETDIKNVGM
ncbi:hypothetical protein C8Q70DRAFT_931781 [Cubamyces menziesii]|nr:hypothetical protein C8Q70DRAFT_931781 [Cubamyces menziesii]